MILILFTEKKSQFWTFYHHQMVRISNILCEWCINYAGMLSDEIFDLMIKLHVNLIICAYGFILQSQGCWNVYFPCQDSPDATILHLNFQNFHSVAARRIEKVSLSD